MRHLLLAVLLTVLLAGCYRQETNESPFGTVGKAVVQQAVDAVTRAQHNRVLGERDKAVATLAAEQVARAQAEAALNLREQRLARQTEVEAELRRELDKMKADREILYANLATITTHNVTQDCPLGDAAYIVTVLAWLRERAATDSG